MRFDPYVEIPEYFYFLPEEVYSAPCIREYVYRFGKMRPCFIEMERRNMVIPLFDLEDCDLEGKYLNIGNGEIYDSPKMVIQDPILENNLNMNYDIYVKENEKKCVKDIIHETKPMTYGEMYEALSVYPEEAITTDHSFFRKEKLRWQTWVYFTEDDNKLITRKDLIKILKQSVLKLKELEQHQAVRVTDLYLGYHKPKGEYETSYGWMFLMRSNHFTFTNVIDMQAYRASDFETIIYYPEYMEKHKIENIYPIYDARMCYEKIKTL